MKKWRAILKNHFEKIILKIILKKWRAMPTMRHIDDEIHRYAQPTKYQGSWSEYDEKHA